MIMKRAKILVLDVLLPVFNVGTNVWFCYNVIRLTHYLHQTEPKPKWYQPDPVPDPKWSLCVLISIYSGIIDTKLTVDKR